MIGEIIGNHQITAQIGQGVTGAVYKAEHTVIGRHVAIKFLRPEYSTDPDLVARFFETLRTVSNVEHPSIVKIFDFGYYRHAAFIVMEYLEYETVEARVRRDGRMRISFALEIIRQVTDALDAVHDVGVIHEDMKADNIALVPDPAVPGGERAKLLDFGLAILLSDPGSAARKVRNEAELPTYVAPEQLDGPDEVDRRADIYAVGAVWYDMICGRPPFSSDDLLELVPMILEQEPPSPRSLVPTIPEEVEDIVMRLLAKKPGQRYSSASELSDALEELEGDFLSEFSSVGASRPPVKMRFSTNAPEDEPAPHTHARAQNQIQNQHPQPVTQVKALPSGNLPRSWVIVGAIVVVAILVVVALV